MGGCVPPGTATPGRADRLPADHSFQPHALDSLVAASAHLHREAKNVPGSGAGSQWDQRPWLRARWLEKQQLPTIWI